VVIFRVYVNLLEGNIYIYTQLLVVVVVVVAVVVVVVFSLTSPGRFFFKRRSPTWWDWADVVVAAQNWTSWD